jgi:hypothetical protein
MQMQKLKLWGTQHMDQMANFCQQKWTYQDFLFEDGICEMYLGF